ncbi:MAG TPA: hypothetical protein VIV40_10280 [Kofleriaceae bacterium]
MRAVSTLIIVALLSLQSGCMQSRLRPTAAQHSPGPVQAQPVHEATPDEQERYAAREQQAGELEKFRGGAASLVGVLVIVLLVVLILYIAGYIR